MSSQTQPRQTGGTTFVQRNGTGEAGPHGIGRHHPAQDHHGARLPEVRQLGLVKPHPADRADRRAENRRRRSSVRALRRRQGGLLDREAGMATAEYAIATLAAVGFAALLVAVLSSGEIRGLLMSLISSALNFG